jgi:hypothetical protein
MRLRPTEEDAIVQHVLDLESRGFPLSHADVKAMADFLLAERNQCPIGSNWPSMFISRRPELHARFWQLYRSKRSPIKDPEAIRDWLQLVNNTKAKYGIIDKDMYNFDETRFLIGRIATQLIVARSERAVHSDAFQQGKREWVTVIQGINAMGWAIPPFIIFAKRHPLSAWYTEKSLPKDWHTSVSEFGWTTEELGLAWLKHFDRHTKSRTVGEYRLLLIDSHESHSSIAFQSYCKEAKIVTLCMPPHSPNLLQPLDVGCKVPFKKAYVCRAETLMRNRGCNHIAKMEFLPSLQAAFDAAFTKGNILEGFRGAGLVPHNPEAVISRLDTRERLWQILNNRALGPQLEPVEAADLRSSNSSRTSVTTAPRRVSGELLVLSHQLVITGRELAEIKKASEAGTRRRSHRRKQVQVRRNLGT